jgi:hypothetical protein
LLERMDQSQGGQMKDDNILIMPIVVCVAIACIASNRIGFSAGIDKVEREAVIKGHAEWVTNQSGKPQFKWKECK